MAENLNDWFIRLKYHFNHDCFPIAFIFNVIFFKPPMALMITDGGQTHNANRFRGSVFIGGISGLSPFQSEMNDINPVVWIWSYLNPFNTRNGRSGFNIDCFRTIHVTVREATPLILLTVIFKTTDPTDLHWWLKI
jgi:hypothetical protein